VAAVSNREVAVYDSITISFPDHSDIDPNDILVGRFEIANNIGYTSDFTLYPFISI